MKRDSRHRLEFKALTRRGRAVLYTVEIVVGVLFCLFLIFRRKYGW